MNSCDDESRIECERSVAEIFGVPLRWVPRLADLGITLDFSEDGRLMLIRAHPLWASSQHGHGPLCTAIQRNLDSVEQSRKSRRGDDQFHQTMQTLYGEQST